MLYVFARKSVGRAASSRQRPFQGTEKDTATPIPRLGKEHARKAFRIMKRRRRRPRHWVQLKCARLNKRKRCGFIQLLPDSRILTPHVLRSRYRRLLLRGRRQYRSKRMGAGPSSDRERTSSNVLSKDMSRCVAVPQWTHDVADHPHNCSPGVPSLHL